MRLVNREWSELVEGEVVVLIPDDAEDTWHLYNLVQPGDFFGGITTRKVAAVKDKDDDNSSAKSKPAASERVTVNITISVTGTSYDAHTGTLRVSGQNATENGHVPLGAAHSIDVQMNSAVRVGKVGRWDSVAEDMLREALSPERAGEGGIAAIVMDERVANICLITPNRTLLKVRVAAEQSKKAEATKKSTPSRIAATAGTNPYYAKVLTTLLRNFDFSSPRPLILASPGFTAANVKNYLAGMTTTEHDSKFFKAQAREVRVVATSSGSLHGLNAVMNGAEMRTAMEGMRFAQEGRYLDRFVEVSKFDDGRAHYGVKPVTKAIEAGAVGPGKGLLLMNNTLFRSTDVGERKRFVALVDAVKAAGGEVRIISSEHESGRQLAMLGNVAAILNFPMPELDEDDDEEEAEEEERRRLEALRRAAERQREGEIDDMVADGFGGL
jgi:protein pelota